MPWWRGGLVGYASGGSTGCRLHAAATAAAQQSSEPARRRRALHSPPQPRQKGWGWDAAAETPARLQHWQMTHAYHAYHEGGCAVAQHMLVPLLCCMDVRGMGHGKAATHAVAACQLCSLSLCCKHLTDAADR